MRRIARKEILVEKRQRKGPEKSLRNKDLRSSIESKGLLHPVVVASIPPDEEGHIYRLVAGGRRLAQIDWIAEDGGYFICDRESILPGEIPVTLLSELSTADLFEAELEENICRIDLEWEDRIRAIVYIHELRQKENPRQTVKATAEEFAKESGGKLNTHLKAVVTESLIIARHLDDPTIKKARNATEAYNLAVKKEETMWKAEQARRNRTLPATINLIEGNCLAIFPTLDAGAVDLIVADPPYGIKANEAGFSSRTVHHHNYDDSAENARRVAQAIFIEGFRVSKARANLFMFCDVDLWAWLQQTAAAAGWTPFRTPIVWAKSDSEGLAPWGSKGPRRTYELLLYATKGQKGLISSPVDILRYDRVAKSERDYGPAKPPALIRELIECSTIPNDLVLDPCCGSGATLVAAKESRRRGLGIELDKNAFNLALARLAETQQGSGLAPEIEAL